MKLVNFYNSVYKMEALDQDILNWVHWKEVGLIDYEKYDYFARVAHNRNISYDEIKEATNIIHYVCDKPWNYTNFHYDIEQVWWDYAKLTPYYDDMLEKFMLQSMENDRVEKYLIEITKINETLKQSLNSVIESMRKYI